MRLTIILILSSFSALAQSRVDYGKQRLAAVTPGGRSFVVTIDSTIGQKEGFILDVKGNIAKITGADASGALYGCLTLADEVKSHGWPKAWHLADHPQMDLRGACIGIQKPTLLP